MKLESISFNTHDLFEEMIELYTVKSNEKNIKIEYEPDIDIPNFVFGDLVKLKQVLANLLSNAIKFTNEYGTVKLVIKKRFVTQKHVELHFKIIDNGIGIPEKDQKNIFNSFEQADTGTSRKFGGTGLGLSISTKILKLMNSELSLKSEKEVGSCFSFKIRFEIDFSSISENKNKEWNMNIGVCFKDTISPSLRERVIRYIYNYGDIVDDFHIKYYNNLDIIFVFYNHDIIKRLSFLKDRYPKTPIIFVGDLSILTKREKTYINDTIDEPLYGSKIRKMLSRYYFKKLEANTTIKHEQFKGKVLVAEDNYINQKLIDLLLKKFGIEAIFASNGEDVVHLFRREQPDLVFMDLHMPVMNGIEATKHISKIQNLKSKVPIIALTADVLREDLNNLKDEGFEEYITKPINIDELRRILLAHLKINYSATLSSNTINEDIKKNLNLKVKTDEQSNDKKTVLKPIYDVKAVAKEMLLDINDMLFLIDNFYLELDQSIENIQNSLFSKEINPLKLELHSLKGSASNLRFNNIVSKLKKMEVFTENYEFEKINLKDLKEDFIKLRKDIDKEIKF